MIINLCSICKGILISGIIFTSCVPQKQFSETETEKNNCINEREELWNENEKLTVENTELKADLEVAEKARKRVEENGLNNAAELKNLKSQYNRLDKRYEDLQRTHESIKSGSDSETRKLMLRLENAQKNLYQREDQLNQMQSSLDKDREELNKLRGKLEQQNVRLTELREILTKKEAETEALRQKVSSALTGFEGQGLSISKKNGKIYVSLDEKLLFKSGSAEVDSRGISALKKLAGVLENNKNINITIEGHTDDVPIVPGSKYKDNWDLSVLRANTIIRILLDDSTINPSRLTSSGRGEFQPVDSGKTNEARQKNRRTEIILTPDLNEVFKLLDTPKESL